MADIFGAVASDLKSIVLAQWPEVTGMVHTQEVGERMNFIGRVAKGEITPPVAVIELDDLKPEDSFALDGYQYRMATGIWYIVGTNAIKGISAKSYCDAKCQQLGRVIDNYTPASFVAIEPHLCDSSAKNSYNLRFLHGNEDFYAGVCSYVPGLLIGGASIGAGY